MDVLMCDMIKDLERVLKPRHKDMRSVPLLAGRINRLCSSLGRVT